MTIIRSLPPRKMKHGDVKMIQLIHEELGVVYLTAGFLIIFLSS